ncbi:hypothetical protein [Hahella chejuensis]|uniref:hypothetical protein n=1 Tax=Hahella chejuensis TaxID=158327 RepID=UPI0005A03700|nr:hypothetical protein [Hahella chejuensis]
MNKFWTALVLLFSSYSVGAVTLECEGKLELVQIGSWQGVYIKGEWNANPQRICDLNGAFKSVSGDVCKLWTSTLQTALYTGKPVRLWYKDVASENCASLPAHTEAPAPAAIYLLK